MHPEYFDYRTNCQMMGMPQTGKSNTAIGNAMECIMQGIGTTFLDYSGPSFDNLVAWCALVRPTRPVYIVNLSDGEQVLNLKIFEPEPDDDLSAHVGWLAETLLKSWGNDLADMPMYKDIVTMVLTFCGELGKPLHLGLRLLDLMEHDLRLWALGRLQDRRARNMLAKIISWEKSPAIFEKVGSTASRLGVFEESKSLLRFCGLPGAVSIGDIIKENGILLVKAAPSASLSPLAARTYLSLLLACFLRAAMKNAASPIKHFMWCDEANQYVTQDAAALLDLTVKSDLRCTFIHHHNLQFKDEALRMSIEQNAGIKYIFNGLPISEKKRYAEEFWLSEANTPQVFESKDRLVVMHYESDYITHTPNGDVMGTRFIPDEHWVEDNVYYTREHQIAILAERFTLAVGECILKLPYHTFQCTMSETGDFDLWTNPATVVEFKKTSPHSITVHEADEKLAEQEARFAAETGTTERSRANDKPRARSKKKSANLFPQG